MKRIEKYEEFKKIWMLYVNERATEKDCEYYFKNQLMLMTADGLVLLLDKKQSIDKDLWYDDETEKPEKTEAFFIKYNLDLKEPLSYLTAWKEAKEDFEKRKCGSGRWDYNGLFFTNCYSNSKTRVCVSGAEIDKPFFVRYLTEEETKELLEIQNELTEKYIKRLKNYWKKYNQNIWIRGYWANR